MAEKSAGGRRHNEATRFPVIVWAAAGAVVTAVVAVMTAVLLLSGGLVSFGPRDYESGGFDRPEDAVEAYLEALAGGELDAMVSAFAIETHVANWDQAAHLDRLRSYQPMVGFKFLDEGLGESLNVSARYADVTQEIIFQYETLCDPEFDRTASISLSGEGEVATFVEKLRSGFNPDKLPAAGSWQQASLNDVLGDMAETYSGEQNQELLAWSKKILGADELSTLAVTLQAPTGNWQMLFEAARYDDRWWLSSLSGNAAALTGIPSTQSGTTKVP